MTNRSNRATHCSHIDSRLNTSYEGVPRPGGADRCFRASPFPASQLVGHECASGSLVDNCGFKANLGMRIAELLHLERVRWHVCIKMAVMFATPRFLCGPSRLLVQTGVQHPDRRRTA